MGYLIYENVPLTGEAFRTFEVEISAVDLQNAKGIMGTHFCIYQHSKAG